MKLFYWLWGDIINFDWLEKTIPLTEITYIQLIVAIAVIIIGYFVAIIVSRLTRRAIIKAKMTKILAEFTARVIKILLIIAVFAFAISILGVNVGEAILGISVVFGFVLGFAFQQTLGNVAAGFMIAITKPFRAGDYIDIAGKAGSVNSVGASITKLTTVDNKRVIIPNSKIWGEAIVNYTALDKRMVDMRVGISYSDDMGKAINIAMDVLKKHKKVLKDPAPNVAVANLGDSSVDLLIRPWVNTSDYWTVLWEITQQIKEAFDKNKISIPFPQTDVHLFQQK